MIVHRRHREKIAMQDEGESPTTYVRRRHRASFSTSAGLHCCSGAAAARASVTLPVVAVPKRERLGMEWILRKSARTAIRTIPAVIRTHRLHSVSTIATLSQGRVCTTFRPAARMGALRAITGHADDVHNPQHSNMCGQRSATFASYTGRGKPTRTRTRVQEQASTEQESTRYSEIARRHDESVAQSRSSDTAANERQSESLHDAGLKNFMVNVYTTTGGCIGMAAVGSVLPILGVVPMVHPLIPGLGMIVRGVPRSTADCIRSRRGLC